MSDIDFWTENYGITTYDQWLSEGGKYVPQVTFHGLGWSKEQTQLFAFEHPYSSLGSMAEQVFIVRGLYGDDPAKLKAVAAAGGNYWQQLLTAGASFIQGGTVPQLIVPDTALVSIEMSSGGQPVVNVVGVDLNGGTVLNATTAVKTAWEMALGPLTKLTSATTMVNYHGMDLSSSTGAIVDVASATAGGGGAGAKATNAACALVKWNGGTRSKSSRGRLYFGPLQESDVNTDGRTILATPLGLISNAFNNFKSSLNTAGFPLVVVSRKLSEATPVVSLTVETVIATQRRRIR